MNYLTVRNWDKFQHYNRRTPPWIKLHRDLLNNYEFSCLQDASKLHLMLIWLLASQMDNLIPADPEWIKTKLQLDVLPDLKALADAGFIDVASKVLASCKQSATPETETETETEREQEKPKPDKAAARFVPPSIQEIKQYCQERNNRIDAEQFHAFYESKGWKVGNQKMKSWKAAMTTWEKRQKEKEQAMPGAGQSHPSYKEWSGHGQG